MVVIEMMQYACVQSFISISPCVLPLPSLSGEKWPEAKFVVVQTICGHHGNDVILMRTKLHLHACYC